MRKFVPGHNSCGCVYRTSKYIITSDHLTIDITKNKCNELNFRKLIEIYDTSRGVIVDTIELYDLSYPYKMSFCEETEEVFILGEKCVYTENVYLT